MDPEPVPPPCPPSPDSQQPIVTSGLDDEWQAKLISLQSQHRQETLQQQHSHLEQLRILQSQLLQDLSSNISLEGGPGVQIFNTNELAASLLLTTKDDGLPSIPEAKEDLRVSREEHPFPATPSRSPAPEEQANGPQVLTHTNMNRSHSLSDSNIPISQSPVSGDEATTEGIIESTTLSATHSLEFLQLPLPDNSIAHPSTHVPSYDTMLLSSITPSSLEQPDTRPATHDTQSTVPHAHGSKSPVYTISGPNLAWESTLLSPSKQTRTIQHISTPDTIRSKNSPSPGVSMTGQRGEGHSRAALLAKHTKHVEDLKLYYETEMTSLRERIGQLEEAPRLGIMHSPQPKLPHSSPVSQRQIKFSDKSITVQSPGKDCVGESRAESRLNEPELWMLQSENGRLKSNCLELQRHLDETERDKHVMEGQVKRMQQHIFEWQERCESSERMVAVLQERLDSTRSQLHKQERMTGQLTSDLKVTMEELIFWKDQKLQDVDKLDQLFHEFEVLQEENQQLLSLNSDLKAKLEDTGSESSALRASLDQYQVVETQYKSTIHRLEDEVRHLEHINNRLHSQATHYDTGWHDDPVGSHSHVIRTPQANLLSHTKHLHSPKSSGPISYSKPEKSPESMSRSATYGSSKKSPGQVSSTPDAVSRTLTQPQSSAGVSSTSRPLTRRKWLETSIPGLIFGSVDDQLPTSTSARLPSRMSPESSSSRPAKRSPKRTLNFNKDDGAQDVAVNFHRNTSTASNEGEPPVHYDTNEDGGVSADSTLRAIREGAVVTSGGLTRQMSRKQKLDRKNGSQSVDERVRHQMEMVGEAEKRLTQLQTERENLEGRLQRTPKTGGRVTRDAKQTQLDMERRLEQVIREIGSVRMVLRKHHALKR